jgi:phospholipid/cholesterol/gamma-HCH transport system substrate-binding protein
VSHLAKIGLLVLVAFGVAVFFVLRIQNISLGGRRGVEYVVEMREAQGIAQKAPVLLKGVRVGRVSSLTLARGGIVARLSIDGEVPLYEGASAQVVSVGLLGEKQLDLKQGDPQAARLAPGAVIPGEGSTSLDAVFARMAAIADDVKEVTSTVKGAIGGEEGANEIKQLIGSVRGVVEEVQQVIAANQDSVKHSVQEVGRLATVLNRLATRLEGLAPDSGTGGSGGAEGPTGFDRLRSAVDRIDVITARIEAGEGTLGGLIVKDDTKQRLDKALTSADQSFSGAGRWFDRLNRTRFSVGVRGDYLTGQNAAKGYFTLDVLPPSRFFARLEAVSLPRDELLSSQERAPMAFSAMGGVRWPHASLRGGLFESRPGLGADLWLAKDRVRVTGEVWDVSRPGLSPHARLEAGLSPVRWFSVVSGWDEPFNSGRDSFYVGGALRYLPEAPGEREKK